MPPWPANLRPTPNSCCLTSFMTMAANAPTAACPRTCSAGSTATSRRAPPSWSRTGRFPRNPACRRWRSRPSAAAGNSLRARRRAFSRRLDRFERRCLDWTERFVDGGLHDGAEEFDRLHHLGVLDRADRELQAEAVVPEPFVLHQDLVDDLLRRTHEIGAVGARTRFEFGPAARAPATFAADAAHCGMMGRKGDVQCFL